MCVDGNYVDGRECVKEGVSMKDFKEPKEAEQGKTTYTGGGSNESHDKD